MKKTILTALAALLVAVPAVKAQKVNKEALLAKIEKSDADIANEIGVWAFSVAPTITNATTKIDFAQSALSQFNGRIRSVQCGDMVSDTINRLPSGSLGKSLVKSPPFVIRCGLMAQTLKPHMMSSTL